MRHAVTIQMDSQFQGFLVHMQHKANREAFSYIFVFFVDVSLLYEKETFLHYSCSEYFPSFFFFKSIEKL